MQEWQKIERKLSRKLCAACGRRFLPGGHWEKHIASLSHQQGARIRALLEANCLTQSEIARRVGLTRERVRQIAKLMGIPSGRERHMVCRIAQLENNAAERLKEFWERPLNKKLLEKCKELGFEAEADFVFPKYGEGGHFTLFVNGRHCRVLPLRRSIQRGKYENEYIRLANSPRACDFYLRFDERNESWWIFPSYVRRRGALLFAEELEHRVPSHWHDYRQYKEAWHLLKG